MRKLCVDVLTLAPGQSDSHRYLDSLLLGVVIKAIYSSHLPKDGVKCTYFCCWSILSLHPDEVYALICRRHYGIHGAWCTLHDPRHEAGPSLHSSGIRCDLIQQVLHEKPCEASRLDIWIACWNNRLTMLYVPLARL